MPTIRPVGARCRRPPLSRPVCWSARRRRAAGVPGALGQPNRCVLRPSVRRPRGGPGGEFVYPGSCALLCLARPLHGVARHEKVEELGLMALQPGCRVSHCSACCGVWPLPMGQGVALCIAGWSNPSRSCGLNQCPSGAGVPASSRRPSASRSRCHRRSRRGRRCSAGCGRVVQGESAGEVVGQ